MGCRADRWYCEFFNLLYNVRCNRVRNIRHVTEQTAWHMRNVQNRENNIRHSQVVPRIVPVLSVAFVQVSVKVSIRNTLHISMNHIF